MPGPPVDRQIRERFGTLVDGALAGLLDDWAETAESLLGLVLLLDQFPRNIWRGGQCAYEGDAKALEKVTKAIEQGVDRQLIAVQRAFLYLPFEHDETVASQQRSTALFQEMRDELRADERAMADDFLRHAREHREIIERFGRFPHRNAILGRESTPEEIKYLKSGGRTFGQTTPR